MQKSRLNKLKFLIYSLLSIFFTIQNFAQKPQEPKDTGSYVSEDVVIKNVKDGVTLTGTFTYPKNAKKVPVVILISGSGAQDRNSELLGHKSFLVIADDFTKKGIGVLRVDDRGTGSSEGVYDDSSLDNFVNDNKSAIDFIKSRKEIDQSKIGLVGHSLGGVIAPIIAAESKDVGFIVMLAGPGVRGDRLMKSQKELFERKMGVDEQSIAIGQQNIGGAYEIILRSDTNREKLQSDLSTYFTSVFGAALQPAQLETIAKQLSMPWLRDFIRFDPETALSNVKCPVLALIGSNDVQVPSKENLDAIKSILQKAGNNDVTTMEFDKMNHLFQESETGLPQEYATIEETFSPKVLNIMSDWILKRTK